MNEKTQKRASFLIDVAFLAVVVAIVYCCLKYVVSWVLPFLVAFAIVTVVHPMVQRIKSFLNIKRSVASILVIVFIYCVVGVLIFLLVMQIALLIRDALSLLPAYYTSTIAPTIQSLYTNLSQFISDLPPQWQETVANIQTEMMRSLQSLVVGISQGGVTLIRSLSGSIPAFVIGLVFTIMLSFFISIHYEKVLQFFRTQLPPRARQLIRDTRSVFGQTIFKYLRAALTLMLITFTEISIVLLFLRQPNAIAIAAGIAVFDALPFFGTGAIVLPWAFIELVRGEVPFALGLVVLYLIVFFVRQAIEPKIVGDNLGLNPVVSLCSIYLGFKLIGVLGMIIMPITTQILLALHKRGSIRIFREERRPEAAEERTETQ